METLWIKSYANHVINAGVEGNLASKGWSHENEVSTPLGQRGLICNHASSATTDVRSARIDHATSKIRFEIITI